MLKEIEKADIEVSDTGENPEAPLPKEMIDLEVCYLIIWYKKINFEGKYRDFFMSFYADNHQPKY